MRKKRIHLMARKTQVGYGTGMQGSTKKGLYGGRSSGKLLYNGGFGDAIRVNFTNIDEDKWDKAFPNGFKPNWDKEDGERKEK
jgi:hypothetical protein